MLKRLYRLFLVLLILSIALWVVLLNRDIVTINLGSGQTYNASLGALIVFIFSAGVLCTALVASLFGFKAYLRERSLLAHERRRNDFNADSAKARSLTTSAQYSSARKLWETLIKREPNDVQARLWLAQTLEDEGNLQDALKVIDAARSVFPGDCEVLFRAARLNELLGNRTAAVDNLALVMATQPSEKAAREARQLSVGLNRLHDALEYNRQLEKLGADRRELREFEAQTRLQELQKSDNHNPEYAKQLKELLNDFPESIATLKAIAEVEKIDGNLETASQALIKAASLEQSIDGWQKAIDFWLEKKQPDRALSVARLSIKETNPARRAQAEELLAKLYIKLGMYSDAKVLIESLEKTNHDEKKLIPLLGNCLLASGLEREAAELWRKYT